VFVPEGFHGQEDEEGTVKGACQVPLWEVIAGEESDSNFLGPMLVRNHRPVGHLRPGARAKEG